MPSPDRATYLLSNRDMPFCRGCGHTRVLQKLDEALGRLGASASEVCLVTDIGCIGLADAQFETTHSVHTTHGRSTAFAAGIMLADAVLARSPLKTVVLIGDGGAMLGLLHLVHAAQLNADITVLLCNNFLFGMTGGQNSATSPLEFVTPTTPGGNILPPLDMCRVMTAANAGFVARRLATDRDLADTLCAAIRHPGFSLVEIVELCTEHGVARNELKGGKLGQILEEHGQELGVLVDSTLRPEFGEVYRKRYPPVPAPSFDTGSGVEPSHPSTLDGQKGIVLAGSAGERVQSAARRFCQAAALCGLCSTQKNDNPVTQGSGFSLSEVIVSPTEILYTGIEIPDAVIAVSRDGLQEIRENGTLDRLTSGSLLILDESLSAPDTPAVLHRRPFRQENGASQAAAKALEYYLELTSVFPRAALGSAG